MLANTPKTKISPNSENTEKMRFHLIRWNRPGRRFLSRQEAMKVLGLEKNFEKSELKTIYLEKAKLYHPDKNQDSKQFEIIKVGLR